MRVSTVQRCCISQAQKHYMFSTPVVHNGGTRGMPKPAVEVSNLTIASRLIEAAIVLEETKVNMNGPSHTICNYLHFVGRVPDTCLTLACRVLWLNASCHHKKLKGKFSATFMLFLYAGNGNEIQKWSKEGRESWVFFVSSVQCNVNLIATIEMEVTARF